MNTSQTSFDEDLFEKNFALFRSVGGDRANLIDLDLAKKYRDESFAFECLKAWELTAESTLLFPRVLPDSDEAAEGIRSSLQKYEDIDSIDRFLDIPGDDPHLFKNIIGLRSIVSEIGFDPNNQHTTADCVTPHNLVCIGTGCGYHLNQIINQYPCYHLFLALPSWEHFVSSFWLFDWTHISNKYSDTNSYKYTIGVYENGDSILPILAENTILGVDHSIIYNPNCDSEQVSFFLSSVTKQKVASLINYLGFTLDEYNMMVNSVKMLANQPKVFSVPKKNLSIDVVVCGSGPSLDILLDDVKRLSKTHLIVASGSNYRALRAHGIRVDVVVIMERNMKWDLYAETNKEFGDSDTRLLSSVTCPVEFTSVFPDAAVFFRPALTPLAVFSNSSRELLTFEGPQSINSGISFASAIGASNVVLAGVDLGTDSPNKTRSNNASGIDDRSYTIKTPGNFGGEILTSRNLLDSKVQAETLISCFSEVNYYNISNGVLFEGTSPITVADYHKMIANKSSVNLDIFYDWWSSLHVYNTRRFVSSWLSRNPRLSISRFFDSWYELLEKIPTIAYFPHCIIEVNKLLSLECPYADQFPRRLTRGCLFKTFAAISRQLIVMGRYPKLQSQFLRSSLVVVENSLHELEQELYMLCDYIENNIS